MKQIADNARRIRQVWGVQEAALYLRLHEVPLSVACHILLGAYHERG